MHAPTTASVEQDLCRHKFRSTHHAQTHQPCSDMRKSQAIHRKPLTSPRQPCSDAPIIRKLRATHQPLTNHSPTTTHPLTHHTLTHTPVAHPLITHSITHQTPKTKICKSSSNRYLNSFVQIKFKNNSILIIFF